MFNTFTKLVSTVVLVIAVLCICIIIHTLTGAVMADVVEYCMGPIISGTVSKLSGTALSAWEIGALVGFVSAFFRHGRKND